MNFKKILSALPLLLLLGFKPSNRKSESIPFDKYPTYKGSDLGLNYSTQKSEFKVWAPTAQSVSLKLYKEGTEGKPTSIHDMQKGPDGTWTKSIKGDLKGQFYVFQATVAGKLMAEVPDPYTKATGVNGKRGAILSLESTNPEGWNQDKRPTVKNYSDIIINELHVRDLSMHPQSGIKNKGKFLGIAEAGTTGPNGVKTGLDHLKDLGITHLHILPFYDYGSVDESKLEQNQFNWGYDPVNYNVLEGSYSTNPADPANRIKEFKQMVKTLHDNKIGVVMDVVYNHTFTLEKSHLNQLVPGYYYRQNKDGSFSDASACGNEVASERAMVRKMIVESVKFWANEYHIDGFRFDLMGIMDIETMNEIRAELDKIDPSIFTYGEGWTASSSPLPSEKRALKSNTKLINKTAAFSDDIRDAIKGHWSDHSDKGFVSGKPGLEESIKFGIVGSSKHSGINYSKVNYSKEPWAGEPIQSINYASCHDDLTLWDKLKAANEDATEEDLIKMHILSNTIVMTSQGVPFLHAGDDFLRTKGGVSNSYKSPDSVNQLDWERKAKYLPIHEFYKSLIHLRKSHPAFRMPSRELVNKHLSFLETDNQIVGYKISNNANGDQWNTIIVLFNGSNSNKEVTIPAGDWTIVMNEKNIDQKGLSSFTGNKAKLSPIAAMVLVDTKSIK